jgi:hypothetical protein
MKKLISKALVMAAIMVGSVFNLQAAEKQTHCPLMIEDEIDAEEFLVYKGVKVFMCCGTCKKMWTQNPDYFAVVARKQAPQLAKVASKEIKPMKQLFCPVYTDTRVHPKSPSIEHNGKKIYFCKTRAVTRFKSNPEKYLKNLK